MKVGDRVRVVSSNPEDGTFDMRFADKVGVIFNEHPFGTDPNVTWFRVDFNPDIFDPNIEPGDNIMESEGEWKERIANPPLSESFWPEELIPIVKVQSNDKDIHIDCPHCDNWEEMGIDDARHHLNVLPIIEWYPDERDKNEVSIHECTQCKKKFEVEWDYTNPIT